MQTARVEKAQEAGRSIVLFDGVCALCNASIRFLMKRDRADRFRFASLQGSFAAGVLARHGKNARDLDAVSVVVDYGRPTERVLSRAAAVSYLLEALGGIWTLARLLRLVPEALLNRLYDFVAANRYNWFGRHDTCPIPTAAERAKFIEDGTPVTR